MRTDPSTRKAPSKRKWASPKPKDGRVREPVTRSGTGFRCKYPSYKLNRTVNCESLLERDACLILDATTKVASYQEQPEHCSYYCEQGQQRNYFPDFRIVLSNFSEELREVKPTDVLKREKDRLKYGLIAKRFTELGRRFRVWTSDDIRREPRFSNAKTLFCNAKGASQELTNAQLAALLGTGTTWTFSQVAERLGKDRSVYQLLKSGLLTFDIDTPLCGHTMLSRTNTSGGNDGSF